MAGFESWFDFSASVGQQGADQVCYENKYLLIIISIQWASRAQTRCFCSCGLERACYEYDEFLISKQWASRASQVCLQ